MNEEWDVSSADTDRLDEVFHAIRGIDPDSRMSADELAEALAGRVGGEVSVADYGVLVAWPSGPSVVVTKVPR